MAKTMTAPAIIESGVPNRSPPKKSWGIFEGMQKRKDANRVYELVASAANSENGTRASKLNEAVSLFQSLDPERQSVPLLKIQKLLGPMALYPFENDINPPRIHLIADFLKAIAPHLPKNEAGDPDTAPYSSTLKSLVNIVEDCDSEDNHKKYPHVVLACTSTLWELGYPSYEFWQRRVSDAVTQEFAIAGLLDMPPAGDGAHLSWNLLKDSLTNPNSIVSIGPAIAASSATNKLAFLNSLVTDSDSNVVKIALGLLVPLSMDSVPRELLDLSKPPIREFWQERIRDSEADAPLTQAAAIGILLGMPAEGDGNPGWSLLRENLRHIVIPVANHPSEQKAEFLRTAALSLNHAIANAAFQATASLKPIPGAIITIAKQRKQKAQADLDAAKVAREGMLGTLRLILASRHVKASEVDEAASDDAVRIAKHDAARLVKRKEAKTAITTIRTTDQSMHGQTSLLLATSEFLEMVELRAKISKGGHEELAGLRSFLGQYVSDRGVRLGYMVPFIMRKHQDAMKNLTRSDLSLNAQIHALNTLSLYEQHGVIINGVRGHTQHAVDALLENGPASWTGILRSLLTSPTPIAHQIIASSSDKKLEFLKAMASTDDPQTVQSAFDAMLLMEEIPREFFDLTHDVYMKAPPSSKIELITKDFYSIMDCLERLDQVDNDQFMAAIVLLNIYRERTSGSQPVILPGLQSVIYKLGVEMVDILAEPGGATPDEKARQKELALGIIADVIMSGVRVNDYVSADGSPSLLQGAGMQMAKIIQATAGSIKSVDTEQNKHATRILTALAIAGIVIPGVNVAFQNATETV